jgi:tRNA A37 N6-isopentenylltransferase MiaA
VIANPSTKADPVGIITGTQATHQKAKRQEKWFRHAT